MEQLCNNQRGITSKFHNSRRFKMCFKSWNGAFNSNINEDGVNPSKTTKHLLKQLYMYSLASIYVNKRLESFKYRNLKDGLILFKKQDINSSKYITRKIIHYNKNNINMQAQEY